MAWEWHNPTNGRWYSARLSRDLFGTTVLALTWGGQRRAGVAHRLLPTRDRAALRNELRCLDARRRAHGYVRRSPS